MTEFAPNWPGWDLRVAPGRLNNVMIDPKGGAALVEIEDSPRQLIADLREAYVNPTECRTVRYYVYKEDARGKQVPDYYQEITNVFPQFKDRFHILSHALRQVMDPVRVALNTEPDIQSLILAVSRRTEQKGHSDGSLLRAWAGSTHPGFFLVKDGQKMPIDSLPEGHVLLMRGGEASQGGVRHGALYRAKEDRFTLLGDD